MQRLHIKTRPITLLLALWIGLLILFLLGILQFTGSLNSFPALLVSAAVMLLSRIIAIKLTEGQLEVGITNKEMYFTWKRAPIINPKHYPDKIALKQIVNYSYNEHRDFYRLTLMLDDKDQITITGKQEDKSKAPDLWKLQKRLNQILRSNR